MNYYNENDPKAAAWLAELIKEGLIPNGHIDQRSIADVSPDDLDGFTQCHFFAGIGGWSEALRLAGWPSDKPVWTGSCPCQPFSSAGKQLGTSDSRHLWPQFERLIFSRKPATVFGEQVASKAGRGWLAGVFADLEAMGYSRAAADLCAAGVNAPHIRQRLWWVADANLSERNRRPRGGEQSLHCKNSIPSWMADSDRQGPQGRGCELVCECSYQCPIGEGGDVGGVGNPELSSTARLREQCGQSKDCQKTEGQRTSDCWSSFDVIPCRDGKFRRVESGTFPLAHGVPGRLGLLRGYGNAIVPQVAAEFIQAFVEARFLISH